MSSRWSNSIGRVKAPAAAPDRQRALARDRRLSKYLGEGEFGGEGEGEGEEEGEGEGEGEGKEERKEKMKERRM